MRIQLCAAKLSKVVLKCLAGDSARMTPISRLISLEDFICDHRDGYIPSKITCELHSYNSWAQIILDNLKEGEGGGVC